MLRLYYLLHAKIHQFLGSRQSRRRTVWKAHSQFILLKYWWIFFCFTLKATISFNINRQARAFGIITFSQRIINRLTLTRALTNVCDCVTGKVVSCVCFHLFMANSLCLFLISCLLSLSFSFLFLNSDSQTTLLSFIVSFPLCSVCFVKWPLSPISIWDPLTPHFCIRNLTFFFFFINEISCFETSKGPTSETLATFEQPNTLLSSIKKVSKCKYSG